MTLQIADRVWDTTTTTGTGVITLANSPPNAYQSFGSVCATNDTIYYALAGRTVNVWEVGLGTYNATGPTLTRTTVFASSNANAAVNLSGTTDVMGVWPASKFNSISGDGTLTGAGVLTVTKTSGVAFAASATTDTTNASNISSGTLAAARLPNPSATTLGGIESLASVASKWINQISTSGVPSATQPAFSDISGTAAVGQLPVMVASGASHAAGIAPDPGASAGTTHFLREDATWAVPAVSSPGGANTDVQFNNSSAFGGDGGFTYAGSGQATLALGTITSNAKALNITGTWNASGVTFDAPLFMNITNTASAAGSLLADLQVGSSTVMSVNRKGQIVSNTAGGTTTGTDGVGLLVWGGDNIRGLYAASGGLTFLDSGSDQMFWGANTLGIDETASIQWQSGSFQALNIAKGQGPGTDPIFAVSSGTNANPPGFFLYNSVDTLRNPTNYERGVFDWTTTANTLTIGTQAGGTGTSRNIVVTSAAGSVTVSNGNTANAIQTTASWSLIIRDGGGILAAALRPEFRFGSASFLTWSSGDPTSVGGVSGIHGAAAKVIGFNDGTGQNINGWMQWAGELRTTSATNYTNATPTTIMSVALQAGRTYSFDGYIPVTAGGTAGGVQVVLNASGGLTATAIQADSVIHSNNVIVGQVSVSSITTLSSAVMGAATGYVEFHGTITVNAAGTLNFQTAQSSTNATTMTIGRGARVFLYDMP